MAGTNITLQSEVGRELEPEEADENIRELDRRSAVGWKDLISPLTIEGIPSGSEPTYEAFGSSGLRRELSFAVGDYAFAEPFHVGHNILVGGKAYVHIHWSTDGIDTNPIKWEFQISRALGHDQEYFTPETSYFVEQSPNQTTSGAWRHYIAEVSDIDAITLIEPDEMILVTARRVANSAVENTDKIFGLTVDFHYESDGDSTPNKAPNFYA